MTPSTLTGSPAAPPDARMEEDTELIRQTLNGNQHAYGKLIQKHQPLLFHMATRILKNPIEAEDVVQEGFIEAYRHLSEFRHHARFSTWLYTIVLNRIRNVLRHGKVLRFSSLDIRRATRDGSRPVEVPERAPSMDDLMEQKLDLEAVQTATKLLPPVYQDIFTLYYFDHLSVAEVARRVQRPPVTIKVYLHRARKMLYMGLTRKRHPAVPVNPNG